MPAIRPNTAKQKLRNNQVATTISGLQNADVIDYLGPLGFDAAWIECEHGPVDWDQLGDMTRACDLWGMTSITRVSANEPWLITRTLGPGFDGDRRSPRQHPQGGGTGGPVGQVRAPGLPGACTEGASPTGWRTTCIRPTTRPMVIVLIEEAEALGNLDEILKVDNIDVFFVAPSDLAQTMGQIGNIGHPEVQAAIDDAIGRIVSAGRTAGTLVNDGNVDRYVGQGVGFLMTSWNGWMTSGASQFLDKAAQASPAAG